MIQRLSRSRPSLQAEFFDGLSDGSFRTGINSRENNRQFEFLDLTVVIADAKGDSARSVYDWESFHR
jgi:hypothetical protein